MLSSFGHVMTAGICRHLSWSCVVSMFLDLLFLVLSTIITILYIRSYSIIYFLEIRIIFNLLHFSLLNYVSLRTIFHQSLALPAIDSPVCFLAHFPCGLSPRLVSALVQCFSILCQNHSESWKKFQSAGCHFRESHWGSLDWGWIISISNKLPDVDADAADPQSHFCAIVALLHYPTFPQHISMFYSICLECPSLTSSFGKFILIFWAQI